MPRLLLESINNKASQQQAAAMASSDSSFGASILLAGRPQCRLPASSVPKSLAYLDYYPLPGRPTDDGVEAYEQTLCQVRTVHVFKIPPRMTSGGYRASDWKEEVWQGGLKVVQKGMDAAVLLIDPKTSECVRVYCRKRGAITPRHTLISNLATHNPTQQTRSSPCAP